MLGEQHIGKLRNMLGTQWVFNGNIIGKNKNPKKSNSLHPHTTLKEKNKLHANSPH